VTLEELAAAAGLSRSHFARAFRASTGCSPFARLRSMRVARSKALLADEALTVAQVSQACGYARQAHFCTAFKAEVGLAPSAYRRSL
jgi:AraC family transcriptional regulator